MNPDYVPGIRGIGYRQFVILWYLRESSLGKLTLDELLKLLPEFSYSNLRASTATLYLRELVEVVGRSIKITENGLREVARSPNRARFMANRSGATSQLDWVAEKENIDGEK